MTSTTPSTDLEREIAAKRAELAELQRLARKARSGKPEPRRIRFTKSTVRALPIPSDRTVTYWDLDVSGLGLRVSPAGSRVYFLQSRTKAGRGVKITLGRADRITAEQAKEAAGAHIAALTLGRNPAAELHEARQAERERRKAKTVEQAWEAFAKDHLPDKRAKTQTAYEGWYRVHIKPALGRIKLADLTSERVRQLHRAATEAIRPSTANRVLAVVSSLLSYAVAEKLVATNVAKGAVKRHREDGRERNLTDAELKALIARLDASPDTEARVIEFLLATGARKGEVLGMRWADLAGDWWTLPKEASKSRKAVRRPLNAVAVAVLTKLERKGALVFQGTTESRLSKWWQRERRALGLDVHVHDLRHAAASLAINAGMSLAAVVKLLGHGVHSAAMTARYSHVADQQLAAASAAVGERLEMLRKAAPAGSA